MCFIRMLRRYGASLPGANRQVVWSPTMARCTPESQRGTRFKIDGTSGSGPSLSLGPFLFVLS